MSFASRNLTAGQLNALVKKIGGEFGVMAVLSDGIRFVPPNLFFWKQAADKSVRLTVKSDGTTGPQWIERLKRMGVVVDKCVCEILHRPLFTPTSGVVSEVVILAKSMFDDPDLNFRKILDVAKGSGLAMPSIETACLVRDRISDGDIKVMGFKWITMVHDPIELDTGKWFLTTAWDHDTSDNELNLYLQGADDEPRFSCCESCNSMDEGFVFVAP